MLSLIPAEYAIFGVYLPPFFLAALMGLVGAVLIAKGLDRTGLSRVFWRPTLAFAALWVLATSLAGLLIISP